MEVEDEIVSTGEFIIRHDEYIEEALDYKYCIICNTMKPLEFFSVHNELSSGRQGECRMCKTKYNSIKNSTRISEQFKESSQKRRMYSILAGKEKIDLDAIFTKFKGKCFKCSEPLTKGEENLDHTLPLYYLYPLSNDNATLLCKDCNLEKAEKWPGNFYKDKKLKKLAFLTGIDYEILAGEPRYNPDALEQIQDNDVMDEILSKYIKYIKDIIKLRNRILFNTGVDLFEGTQISKKQLDDANDKYSKKYER